MTGTNSVPPAGPIAGVVILYNPEENVVENIRSYIGQVDRLFVIDNSDQPSSPISEEDNDVWQAAEYINNGANFGVATALNRAAVLAVARGYRYLLTMDQDSVASPDMVHRFRMYLHDHAEDPIGILSPCHIYKNFDAPVDSANSKTVFTTITSGSLLSLTAYARIGPFLDDLFIDYVDFEFCLRLHIHGFQIVQVAHTYLEHVLGDPVRRRILFRSVVITNHPPIRVYYKFRNRLYVARRYFCRFPLWSTATALSVITEGMKIVCLERDRKEKVLMTLRGIRDCVIGRIGRYGVHA